MRDFKTTAVLFLLFISFPKMVFASSVPGKYFDRVIFVVFENTDYKDAIAQPFFLRLAQSGVNLTNFSAETHPSQGNYIALTSGSLNGVRSDGSIDLDVNHIGDLLDAKGISWRVYAEGYPGNCFKGTSKNGYVRKHNPFISYTDIQINPSRCAKIVDSDQFDRDMASGRLPQYVFYVPDQWNDGHDTDVSFADRWYQHKFGPLVSDLGFMDGTLLISTFDESGSFFGKNQIYTTLVGPMVTPGGAFSNSLNHYSLLRLVEENWNLGSLGRDDASAQAMPNVWR